VRNWSHSKRSKILTKRKIEVAKRRKIRNMTRAEHKRILEGAVRNQIGAMQQMKGQVFLPQLGRRGGKHQGDTYERTVAAGQELIQKGYGGTKEEQILAYYSRKDVQQAMYQYARGRKISVLRTFRPMFQGSELRKSDDILPIMMFYSQQSTLWPSMHGTVSRTNGDGSLVCDLVVEVDFKKSRARSFGLSRPIIRLFWDLGLEFRVKFSGNASPHIIIPAEAFPQKWRKVGNCRNIYGKLLDFLRKQIKDPKTLDGSFRNPHHFLRMPYSLNENTGLASVPFRVENFDRFSWEMARPEMVEVIEDWWSISEDAQERTQELIDMAMGQKTVIAMKNWGEPIEEVLTLRMPEVLSTPMQIGMVKTGEEIAARGNALAQEPSMQDALLELRTAWPADKPQDATERWRHAGVVAKKHSINKGDMQLLWQWSDRTDVLDHYSRDDVQEAMYSYTQGRCVRLEGMEEYLTLNQPSDIPALAGYMIGGGVAPVFQCTNAQYYSEDDKMTSCDMVIQVDQSDTKHLNPTISLLQSHDIPSFVLYNGDAPLRVVIPLEILEAGADGEWALRWEMSRLPELASAFNKWLRHELETLDGMRVYFYEGYMPIPYSITDDGKNVNLPVRLADVPNLSPEMASIGAVGEIEDAESFIPPDSEQRVAEFFAQVVL